MQVWGPDHPLENYPFAGQVTLEFSRGNFREEREAQSGPQALSRAPPSQVVRSLLGFRVVKSEASSQHRRRLEIHTASGTTAKVIQKEFRRQLVATLEEYRAHSQFAGLPRRFLEQPSSMVRSHFAQLCASSQTGGALFIDSRAAYYAIVRDSLVSLQG